MKKALLISLIVLAAAAAIAVIVITTTKKKKNTDPSDSAPVTENESTESLSEDETEPESDEETEVASESEENTTEEATETDTEEESVEGGLVVNSEGPGDVVDLDDIFESSTASAESGNSGETEPEATTGMPEETTKPTGEVWGPLQ